MGSLQAMLTANEHVERVHQIIQESLALDNGLLFPEFVALLQAVIADRKPLADSLPWLLLPIFTCEALTGEDLGRNMRRAQQVAAALEVGRIAAACLDEWQDQDTNNALWRSLGAARTVNVATGLISLSFLVLSRLGNLGAEASLILSLHQEFHQTMMLMCAGQEADLTENLSLDDYERVAGAKSGSLFRLGCRAGALVAGARLDIVTGYGDFAYNLGIVAQMWNDLQGLSGVQGKGGSDQRRSLPILASQAIKEMASGPSPKEEQIGPLYALVQLQVFHQRAAAALARCPAAGRLSLFLDIYATAPLVERTKKAVTHPGEHHDR